ncbi:LOW QUALITY PROTEIN: uncharacterized protein FYW61_016593 [Anableps anableps]
MPRGKSYCSEAARRVEAAQVQRTGIPKPSSDFDEHTGLSHKLVIPDGSLDKKVVHAVLPRESDAVCVMAPSNNLMVSINHEEVGQEFERYLLTICRHWPKVFCTGMVPCLMESRGKQDLFQQEYHNIQPHVENKKSHLDDKNGIRILSELIWIAAYQFLELSAQKPLVQSQRNHSGESESPSDSPKKRVVHHEMDGTPVALKECYIPLNPVWFSPDMLVAMEKVSPSALKDVHTGNKVSATPCTTPATVSVELVSTKKKKNGFIKEIIREYFAHHIKKIIVIHDNEMQGGFPM